MEVGRRARLEGHSWCELTQPASSKNPLVVRTDFEHQEAWETICNRYAPQSTHVVTAFLCFCPIPRGSGVSFGRSFRAVPSAIQSIANNFSIGEYGLFRNSRPRLTKTEYSEVSRPPEIRIVKKKNIWDARARLGPCIDLRVGRRSLQLLPTSFLADTAVGVDPVRLPGCATVGGESLFGADFVG